jgi:hypothetical protein
VARVLVLVLVGGGRCWCELLGEGVGSAQARGCAGGPVKDREKQLGLARYWAK